MNSRKPNAKRSTDHSLNASDQIGLLQDDSSQEIDPQMEEDIRSSAASTKATSQAELFQGDSSQDIDPQMNEDARSSGTSINTLSQAEAVQDNPSHDARHISQRPTPRRTRSKPIPIPGAMEKMEKEIEKKIEKMKPVQTFINSPRKIEPASKLLEDNTLKNEDPSGQLLHARGVKNENPSSYMMIKNNYLSKLGLISPPPSPKIKKQKENVVDNDQADSSDLEDQHADSNNSTGHEVEANYLPTSRKTY